MDNRIVSIDIVDGELIVTFQDGSTQSLGPVTDLDPEELSAAILKNAGDIVTLKRDVSALQAAAGAAEVSIKGIKDDIDALEEGVAELKNDFTQFPSGNYPQMGAGYANQLVSGLKKEDQTPYNFRRIPYDATLEEVKKIVGGTVVNNQLFNFPQQNTSNGVTLTFENGVVTLSGTATSGYCSFFTARITGGHKILVDTKVVSNPDNLTITFGSLNSQGHATIGSSSITNANNLAYASGIGIEGYGGTGTVFNNVKFQCVCTDLTQMLGTTIADYVYNLEQATAGAGVTWLKEHFPKQFDNGYQAYDAGTLKSIEGLSGKKTVGFNQWDEQWENGSYSDTTGTKTYNANKVRCKNFIHVLPNTQYFCHLPTSLVALNVCWYGINKQFMFSDHEYGLRGNSVFTVPNGCYYMTFSTFGTSYTTYNHDICINLSDPTKNGTYEPYEAHSYALDSDVVLRGIPKLDSNNQLYYDGDEYLPDGTVNRRYGIVDLETLNWEANGGNAGQFYALLPAKSIISNYRDCISNKYVTGDSYNRAADKVIGANGLHVWVYDTSLGTSVADLKTALSGGYFVYKLAESTTETADPYTTPQIISPDGTEEYIYTDGAFELPVGHSSDYPVNVSGQLDDILDTPSANGTYTLKATVADGAVTYSWVADA